jgi:hypothetical protein
MNHLHQLATEGISAAFYIRDCKMVTSYDPLKSVWHFIHNQQVLLLPFLRSLQVLSRTRLLLFCGNPRSIRVFKITRNRPKSKTVKPTSQPRTLLFVDPFCIKSFHPRTHPTSDPPFRIWSTILCAFVLVSVRFISPLWFLLSCLGPTILIISVDQYTLWKTSLDLHTFP